VLNTFLMFEIYLVSSWDTSHSHFGRYQDTTNFIPWTITVVTLINIFSKIVGKQGGEAIPKSFSGHDNFDKLSVQNFSDKM
jgi:uncharacterized membrane protein